MNDRFRILIVDHDPAAAQAMCDALRHEGYTVEIVREARKALEAVRARAVHAIVAATSLPDGSALQLLHLLRKRHAHTQFVFVTPRATVEDAIEAVKAGAFDYLTKPVDARRLTTSLGRALESAEKTVPSKSKEDSMQDDAPLLVGESDAIRRLVQTAEDVARSDVTVLLEGESGTGKELVARIMHQQSARANKPFITVNCAAFAEPLLEGELFGHVKGAFTGAVMNKRGRFQMADGGTLFLDEIGDLPAKGQGDILRVLEDGAFRMVGGTELVRVNVRIVAATNKRLQDAVTAGRFREDLYYRLQVVPIVVPPLRDRAEDIPLLIDAFVEQFARKHRRRRLHFSAEALQRCRNYPWPGNVRQLRNAIERLVVTAAGPFVDVDALPDFLRDPGPVGPACEIRPGMSISECEKLLIRQTLLHATTNREKAARMLGISRRTLQYKLKEYGLLPPRRTPPESSALQN